MGPRCVGVSICVCLFVKLMGPAVSPCGELRGSDREKGEAGTAHKNFKPPHLQAPWHKARFMGSEKKRVAELKIEGEKTVGRRRRGEADGERVRKL